MAVGAIGAGTNLVALQQRYVQQDQQPREIRPAATQEQPLPATQALSAAELAAEQGYGSVDLYL